MIDPRESSAVCLVFFVALLGGQSLLSAQTVHVSEAWATKGPADHPFVSVDGAVADSSGLVWISDPRAVRLLAYSPHEGRFRVFGRRGGGPGEFESPTLLALRPEGGIAVYDVGRIAIELFDRSGKFERRLTFRPRIHNAKGFLALSGSRFLLSGGSFASKSSVYLFDEEGKVIGEWFTRRDIDNLHAEVLIAGGALGQGVGGRVIYSQAAPHRIVASQDSSLREWALIAEDPALLPEIGDDFVYETEHEGMPLTAFKWRFPKSRFVRGLEDGRILNIIRWYDRGISIWELYDPDGNLLSRTEVPKAYVPHDLTPKGQVLASYLDPETMEVILVSLNLDIEGRPDLTPGI